MELIPRRTPEQEELERKSAELKKLEAQLVDGEMKVVLLQGQLRAFEMRYLKVVGIKLTELDDLEAKVAEAVARRSPHNAETAHEAARSRAQAEASARLTDEALRSETREMGTDPSLNALYREVARQVHPDLTTDSESKDLRTRLMGEANAAYRAGDRARLQSILDSWHDRPESVVGVTVEARLIRVIRQIAQARRRLEAIARELADLTGSELAKLMTAVVTGESRGEDVLAAMERRMDRRIAAARSQLAAIVASD